MEDYDVLGNFKDLKTIFKNIPAAPLQAAPLVMENSFSDLDALLDGSSSSTDKKLKHNSKKQQTTKIAKTEQDQEQKNKKKADLAKSKTKGEVVTTVEPAAANNTNSTEPPIAARTRRSLRSQNTSIDNQTTAVNDNTLNNTKKNGRGRPPRNAIDNSTTEVAAAVAEKPTRGRKRAGNSTHNSSTTIAQVAQAVAEIPTRGRRRRTAAQPAAPVAIAQPTTIDTIEISDTFETRDATRARRNLIADVAARCPTVGVVDLVSSPVVRVEGFIDLVDDDKPNTSQAKPQQQQQQSMDFSFNEDNPEMNVKINWEFKLKTFELRKYQKFTKIFEELAKEQNIDVNSVVLNLNSHFIKPDDTPASIDYKIYQFIEGRAMKPTEFGGTRAIKKKRDVNVIKLKIQTNKHKKPMQFELKKTESFRTLVIKCAEELKVPYENITKLCFDGETVDINQTPVDLELDGGEMIEIHLKD